MKVGETIERDLNNEPQSVVRVYEDAQLKTDFSEYVLTDVLAREFEKVLGPIVESARPASPGTNSVGIWVSGFFGSGKSSFAKMLGLSIGNRTIAGMSASSRFAQRTDDKKGRIRTWNIDPAGKQRPRIVHSRKP